MNRLSALVAMALMAVAGFSLGGCASVTPAQQYSASNEAFIAAQRTLNTAREVGLIDDETWDEQILPSMRSGNSFMRQWRVDLDAGVTDQADYWQSQLRRVTRLLVEIGVQLYDDDDN